MENINQRFLKVLEEIGVSGYKVAGDSGVAQSTLTNIRAGRTKPNVELLEWLLLNYEGVSAEYLMRGTGEPVSGKVNTIQKQKGKNQNQRVAIALGQENEINEADCEKLLKAKDETIAALQKTIDLYERMLQTK